MKHQLAALFALVACSCGGGQKVVLEPQVHLGPAQNVRPKRILALSASCGSVEFSCPHRYIETVDGIVRSSLDFTGFTVVDPETLRAETRQRHVTKESENTAKTSKTTIHEDRPLAFDRNATITNETVSHRDKTTTVLDGPGFEDLTVAERRAVVSEAKADAVLITRIVVGAQHGVWSPDQEVEVLVKLQVDSGDTMAWASRCVASSNDFATIDAALENATRCAVYGGTGN